MSLHHSRTVSGASSSAALLDLELGQRDGLKLRALRASSTDLVGLGAAASGDDRCEVLPRPTAVQQPQLGRTAPLPATQTCTLKLIAEPYLHLQALGGRQA